MGRRNRRWTGLCASLAVLAAASAPGAASAGTVTFSYSGSIVDYTIVNSGLYSLFAAGAQGGAIPETYMQQNTGGGLGATVSGAETLYAGDVLEIAVGGRGLTSDYTAGGGGGTFVALLRGGVLTPLIVAGGGGGAGFSNNQSGRSGGAGPDGSGGGDYLPAADGICGGAGGSNGGGGSPGQFCGSSSSWPQYPGGAGGAGFYGKGGDASFDGATYAGGGQSFAAGLAGGVASSGNGAGGFGGGGAGYGGSGGGGGGYSGGGGGSHRTGQGGGGGSYYDPGVFDVSVVSGAQSGDGSASLEWRPPIVVALPGAAVPEPATWAMMLLGLGGIGAALRRNRNGAPVAA